MPAAFVQQAIGTQGGNGVAVTFGSAVGAGHAIIAVIADLSIGTGTLSVSDNNGNSYTLGATLNDATNTTILFAFAICQNPTLTPNNPPTLTANDSMGSNHQQMSNWEYSGLTGAMDGQSASASSSTGSETTSNLTTTVTDVLISVFANGGNGSYSSGGTGWGHVQIDNTNDQFLFQDQENVAASTYDGSCTYSLANADWGGAIAAFKVAAGASFQPDEDFSRLTQPSPPDTNVSLWR